ncbi:MAG: EfeM/EfeO family lipoprotein [Actinobacteria bacterium]|nr:EfeM/EfeO family lipoprotein [Actinomycetota bacterium]
MRSNLLPTRPALAVLAVLALPVLAACTESTDTAGDGAAGGDARTVAVTSSEDACELSATEAPSGTLRFDVSNAGSQVTEFYLLDAEGLAIKGEVENVGPQATRQLVLNLPAGDYTTACKPGMTGEGIRAAFTVTDSGEEVEVSADEQALVEQALTSYATYVRDQSDQLLERTREFVDLYEAGDDDAARELYPLARVHWERIETVAESFGDLDPKMDLREADLEPGQEWTGWHRIEKDLWPARAEDYTPLTDAEREEFAQDLLANTEKLDARIQELDFTVDQITNGSRGLLEEVATGKVTGEEEYWSRTDLYDFQANVDGARVGFEGVAPILETKDPALATELDDRFAELEALLDQHRVGEDGFVSYDELSPAEVKELANAVNALSEPLSRLTAAVLA